MTPLDSQSEAALYQVSLSLSLYIYIVRFNCVLNLQAV